MTEVKKKNFRNKFNMNEYQHGIDPL